MNELRTAEVKKQLKIQRFSHSLKNKTQKKRKINSSVISIHWRCKYFYTCNQSNHIMYLAHMCGYIVAQPDLLLDCLLRKKAGIWKRKNKSWRKTKGENLQLICVYCGDFRTPWFILPCSWGSVHSLNPFNENPFDDLTNRKYNQVSFVIKCEWVLMF
jgi:hypothetical protein